MYQPDDIVRFTTPKGRILTGKIRLRGDSIALIIVDKPAMQMLIDMERIIDKITP